MVGEPYRPRRELRMHQHSEWHADDEEACEADSRSDRGCCDLKPSDSPERKFGIDTLNCTSNHGIHFEIRSGEGL